MLDFRCQVPNFLNFRSMIPVILEAGKNVTLLAGYREDILYDSEFRALSEKYPNFQYYTILSSEGGYVQDLLDKVPEDFSGDYFICGLIKMIKDIGKKLSENGVEGSRIKFERYD